MRILLMLFLAFYVFAQNDTNHDNIHLNSQKIIREKIYNTRVQFQTCLFNYDMQLREHEFEYNLHISDVIHQIMTIDDNKNIDVSKLQNLDYEIQRLQHEQKIISENIKNDSAIHCGIIEEDLFNLEEELYNYMNVL